MKRIAIILLCIISLLSCQIGNDKPLPVVREVSVANLDSAVIIQNEREFYEVRTEFFNNLYIATPDSCLIKKLESSFFTIEYPDSMDIKYLRGNEGHIQFDLLDNGVVKEQLTIGSSGLTISSQTYSYNYMKKLSSLFQAGASEKCEFNIEMVGSGLFLGQNVDMIKAHVVYPEDAKGIYRGRYKFISLLIFPSEDKTLDAVIITLGASENSDFKSFNDFENKGVISQMIKSFRYVE